MEGKGWFIIYGLLLLAVIYLFISHLQLAGQVQDLRSQLAALRSTAVTPEPVITDTPSPDVNALPDNGTPESRDSIRKADLANIKAAILSYRKDHSTSPPDDRSVVPKYLPGLPRDPLDPKFSYRYKKTGPQTFQVTCVLENKNDPDGGKDGKRDGVYTLTDQG